MAMDFERLQHDPVSRRAFLQRMGAAGLGLAAANLLQGCGGGGGSNNNGGGSSAFPRSIPGTGDIQALNFALTLEILEADLYRQALNKASGKPQNPNPAQEALDPFGSYTLAVPPGTFPGSGPDAATRGAVGFLYLKQFTFVEAAHRDFLRAAIQANGGTPTTRNPKGYRFNAQNNPGATIAEILAAILPLEETGVRAYLGATPLIKSAAIAQIAGTIYSTEARHSAAVGYILDENKPGPIHMAGDKEVASAPPGYSDVAEQLFEKFLSPATVVKAAVSAYFVP